MRKLSQAVRQATKSQQVHKGWTAGSHLANDDVTGCDVRQGGDQSADKDVEVVGSEGHDVGSLHAQHSLYTIVLAC